MLASYKSCMADSYGPSIDVWSLGVMMFYFLSGGFPYDFEDADSCIFIEAPINFKRIKTSISADCRDALVGLLQFKVGDRICCSEKGWKELMEHRLFFDINWSKLLKKKVDPPYIPKKKREWDTRHNLSHKVSSSSRINDIIKAYVKREKGDYAEWMQVPKEKGQEYFADWDVVSQTTLQEEMQAQARSHDSGAIKEGSSHIGQWGGHGLHISETLSHMFKKS